MLTPRGNAPTDATTTATLTPPGELESESSMKRSASPWLEGLAASARRPAVQALIGALLLALGLAAVRSTEINHDVAWVVTVASRLVQGDRLFVDLIDVNPPLIFLWFVPPAFLSSRLAIDLVFAAQMWIGLQVVASLLLCRRQLARTPRLAGTPLPAVVVLSLTAFLVPVWEFGQREHLMLLMVLPYLLLVVRRLDAGEVPRGEAMLVGIAAGIGFALKPYFLIAAVAVEVHGMMRHGMRWLFRPESLAIVLLQILYVATVFVVYPEYLDLARMATQVYGAYGERAGAIVGHLTDPAIVVAVATALLVRSDVAVRPLAGTLLAGGIGFLLAALLQGKGWDYHYYPMHVCAWLTVVVLITSLVARSGRSRLLGGPVAGVVLVAAVGLFVTGLERFRAARSRTYPTAEIGRELARLTEPGDTIVGLTTSLTTFPHPLYAGSYWGSRFNCLWLLPGNYTDSGRSKGPFPYHEPAAMGEIERFQFRGTIEDLLRTRPRLLIVDRNRYKLGFGSSSFDFLEYFRQDSTFARFLTGYDSAGLANGHLLLLRRDGSPRADGPRIVR